MSASDSEKLPTTPEEVTLEWLQGIFGSELKAIEATSSVLNATASKLFYTLTYEDERPETERPTHICIKGGFNPAMLAVESYRPLLVEAYTREATFFRNVAPKLADVRLPKAWWTGINAEQGQAIVIMDDLNHKGCTFGDPVFDWPVERVSKGVEQLAAVHAATWGWSLAQHAWLTPTYENIMIGLTNMWDDQVLAEGRPPFPDVIKNRDRTVPALKKHYATKNPKFICLLHGDPHSGNTFIDAEDNPSFLDWQIVYSGSAIHDFAYFVVGALSVEDRRAHEKTLLEHYLKSLAEHGGPGFSVDDEEVMREYRKCTLTGLGWVLTPYDMQRKDRVIAMCERYCAAIVDHEAIELVESLPDPE